MKKKLHIAGFIILVFLAMFADSIAQKVTVDAQGNYHAVKEPRNLDSTGANTGKTYTDTKGRVYPVYKTKQGRLFVIRMSGAGNVYKVYLKIKKDGTTQG